MSLEEPPAPDGDLCGLRVRLVGRFASVPAREAGAAVERRGGVLDDLRPQLIVVGEEATAEERQAAEADARQLAAECLAESELWRRLGLVGDSEGAMRLYSPAMLAELVGAPVAAVRRWERRELLRPTSRVNRLPFFDFEEVRVAQRLAELLAELGSLAAVDAVAARLTRMFPGTARPLADLPLVIEGGELLLRSEETLQETTGQRRLDFDAPDADPSEEAPTILSLPEAGPYEPATLCERAWAHAEEGRLAEAIDSWRLAMLETPPTADDHFVLAEWLYADGQTYAARERYYAALEVDPDHLEARVNLGCVLSDLGDYELAAASVQGAIDQHEAYPDAHFHLARIHHRRGDDQHAEPHWRRFLELAPESPWAEEARERLGPS